MAAETDALEPAEPIAGPVPLPRAKPHGRVALLAGAVPLPRPRPAEIAARRRIIPAVDRHAIALTHSIASPVAIRTGANPSALSAARISSACAASRVSTVTSSRAPLAGTSRNSRR